MYGYLNVLLATAAIRAGAPRPVAEQVLLPDRHVVAGLLGRRDPLGRRRVARRDRAQTRAPSSS